MARQRNNGHLIFYDVFFVDASMGFSLEFKTFSLPSAFVLFTLDPTLPEDLGGYGIVGVEGDEFSRI